MKRTICQRDAPNCQGFLENKAFFKSGSYHERRDPESNDKQTELENENEIHLRKENIRKNSLSEDGKFSCSAHKEISHLNNDNSCPICSLRSFQNQLTLQWSLF
jgi:hypothetical protein